MLTISASYFSFRLPSTTDHDLKAQTCRIHVLVCLVSLKIYVFPYSMYYLCCVSLACKFTVYPRFYLIDSARLEHKEIMFYHRGVDPHSVSSRFSVVIKIIISIRERCIKIINKVKNSICGEVVFFLNMCILLRRRPSVTDDFLINIFALTHPNELFFLGTCAFLT